jgi:hypothetical protein
MQILADSMLAFNSLSPYKFEATMNMQMNIIGGPEAMDTGADITMSGVSNMADKEMQANMTMSMDSSSPDFPDEMQNVEIEMYMLTDLIYMKMNIAGMFDQWIKMPVSEEVMAQYDFNMVNQQLQFLEAPADISLLKEETFDGSECYVLQVIPDMQKLIQWMNEEQFAGELDLSPIEQISDAFKELSLLSWIDKDSKQIRKMDLNMTMEIMPGQLDTEDADFDKMIMDIYMQMNISGYNEPVSIVLPDEAQNAMEISPEMISQ